MEGHPTTKHGRPTGWERSPFGRDCRRSTFAAYDEDEDGDGDDDDFPALDNADLLGLPMARTSLPSIPTGTRHLRTLRHGARTSSSGGVEPGRWDADPVERGDLSELDLLRDVMSLVVSASSWMDDAMRAWAAGDFAKVGLMAPLAVEHLGKAVLWNRNPVLLVQLNPNDEASLMTLATAPNLASKTLRTVGLKLVLTRVEKVLDGAPVLVKNDCERMVNVRNGITHVGTADLSRHVLLDALTVMQALLGHLDIDPQIFFGTHTSSVTELLDAKRTEVGHAVLEKRARARQRVEQLKETLGRAEYEKTAGRLEDQREELTGPNDMGYRLEAANHDCPECNSIGRLFGYIELEEQMDFDVEPLGGGRYEPIPMPYWEIWFSPRAFECAVCRLSLISPDELTEAGLSTERREVSSEDLGDGFDLDEVIRNAYGPDDF